MNQTQIWMWTNNSSFYYNRSRLSKQHQKFNANELKPATFFMNPFFNKIFLIHLH